MRRRVRLSQDEARRIALAAQGFDRARPRVEPDARHFRRVMSTLNVMQLDFVNVLLPAHYLVVWSRLGPYDRERFDRHIYGAGEYTEQWAHEASIVPTSTWPLLAFRRGDHELSKQNPLRRLRNRNAYLEEILETVRRDGPLTASDLPHVPGPKLRPGDWHRSMPRWALEYHFARGDLAIAGRKTNFQRIYDLADRLVPGEHLGAAIDRDAAHRALLCLAADSLGVATLHDLADYFRLSPVVAGPRLEELVEDGALSPVSVDGWDVPAYLAKSARLPRAVGGASLMSPFDPLVWYRPRAERLFDFHYRIEIYVPAAQRKWGYYVLPFRIGDRIVARVDLKADRQARRLLVLASHDEAGTDHGEIAEHLADELDALQNWLQLDGIDVRCSRKLSRVLAGELPAARRSG